MSPSLQIHDCSGTYGVRKVGALMCGLRLLSMRRAAGWITSGALALAVVPRVSFGQSKPVIELRWEVPAQCPNASYVQERIRDIVGDLEVTPDRLRAEGRIISSGEKYQLTLVVTSGTASGKRELESESCEHLSGAAAVALSLLARAASNQESVLTTEDLGDPETGPDAGSGPPNTPDAAEGLKTTPPAPMGPQRNGNTRDGLQSKTAFRWHLRVPTIGVSLNSMPGLTSGYGLGVGVSYAKWETLLNGYYWPARELEGRWSGQVAKVAQYSVDLDFCRTWLMGRFGIGTCLRSGLTRLLVTGTSVGLVPESASATTFRAGAGILVRLHITDWAALFASGATEINTSRIVLTNEGLGQVYQFPLLNLKFGLGTELIF
jgi:hypothetical protein